MKGIEVIEEETEKREKFEQLLTPENICEWLNISKPMLYKMVRLKALKFIKIGTLLRFKKSDIELFLNNNEKGGRNNGRFEWVI